MEVADYLNLYKAENEKMREELLRIEREKLKEELWVERKSLQFASASEARRAAGMWNVELRTERRGNDATRSIETTGLAKRENYCSPSISRHTNTSQSPAHGNGDSQPQFLINETKDEDTTIKMGEKGLRSNIGIKRSKSRLDQLKLELGKREEKLSSVMANNGQIEPIVRSRHWEIVTPSGLQDVPRPRCERRLEHVWTGELARAEEEDFGCLQFSTVLRMSDFYHDNTKNTDRAPIPLNSLHPLEREYQSYKGSRSSDVEGTKRAGSNLDDNYRFHSFSGKVEDCGYENGEEDGLSDLTRLEKENWITLNEDGWFINSRNGKISRCPASLRSAYTGPTASSMEKHRREEGEKWQRVAQSPFERSSSMRRAKILKNADVLEKMEGWVVQEKEGWIRLSEEGWFINSKNGQIVKMKKVKNDRTRYTLPSFDQDEAGNDEDGDGNENIEESGGGDEEELWKTWVQRQRPTKNRSSYRRSPCQPQLHTQTQTRSRLQNLPQRQPRSRFHTQTNSRFQARTPYPTQPQPLPRHEPRPQAQSQVKDSRRRCKDALLSLGVPIIAHRHKEISLPRDMRRRVIDESDFWDEDKSKWTKEDHDKKMKHADSRGEPSRESSPTQASSDYNSYRPSLVLSRTYSRHTPSSTSHSRSPLNILPSHSRYHSSTLINNITNIKPSNTSPSSASTTTESHSKHSGSTGTNSLPIPPSPRTWYNQTSTYPLTLPHHFKKGAYTTHFQWGLNADSKYKPPSVRTVTDEEDGDERKGREEESGGSLDNWAEGMRERGKNEVEVEEEQGNKKKSRIFRVEVGENGELIEVRDNEEEKE